MNTTYLAIAGIAIAILWLYKQGTFDGILGKVQEAAAKASATAHTAPATPVASSTPAVVTSTTDPKILYDQVNSYLAELARKNEEAANFKKGLP